MVSMMLLLWGEDFQLTLYIDDKEKLEEQNNIFLVATINFQKTTKYAKKTTEYTKNRFRGCNYVIVTMQMKDSDTL